MRTIGTVARLQIQRSSLKTGEKPNRAYDPAPLLPVSRLTVTPDGVLGAGPDGGWIVDVHHRAHPETKNEDGLHGVSVGFTSHYAAMRERFGERIVVGCAGENVIVTADRMFTYEELAGGGGVAIVAPDGTERVRLKVLQVAHPCRPFTGWALGGRVESEVLKENLQFLDGGTRGFYCVGEGLGTVEMGDRVVLL
jgi:hypothetical protein